MKKLFLMTAMAVALASLASDAYAIHPRARAARDAAWFASARPWHGDYAYTPIGGPVALVVPPHADTMAAWGWGVTSSEIRPLYHQFGRADPGGAFFGETNPFLPTPLWPSHTDQFGVYPVRGPWR
jgi:hypothetical protein